MKESVTTDLVSRLRDHGKPSPNPVFTYSERLCREAADEIERLRAALRAAHQYVIPGIDRGPAHRSWCLMVDQVEPLIGESECRGLMRAAGVSDV